MATDGGIGYTLSLFGSQPRHRTPNSVFEVHAVSKSLRVADKQNVYWLLRVRGETFRFIASKAEGVRVDGERAGRETRTGLNLRSEFIITTCKGRKQPAQIERRFISDQAKNEFSHGKRCDHNAEENGGVRKPSGEPEA